MKYRIYLLIIGFFVHINSFFSLEEMTDAERALLDAHLQCMADTEVVLGPVNVIQASDSLKKIKLNEEARVLECSANKIEKEYPEKAQKLREEAGAKRTQAEQLKDGPSKRRPLIN